MKNSRILKYFGPHFKPLICKARTPWGCVFRFLAVFASWFELGKIEQLHSFLFQKIPYQYNVADIHYFSNSDQVCSSTYATGFGVIKLLWSTFHTQVYTPLVPRWFQELSRNCSLLRYPLCYKNLSATYFKKDLTPLFCDTMKSDA